MNLRKTFSAMAAVVAATAALTACAGTAKTETNQPTEETKEMKTLVAYFSASGVTEGVAKQIATATGGDLFKIDPEQPYTDADLDWTDKSSRSTLEMQDKSSRPAIASKVDNIADYDVIYLGFPIWWYTAPTIINTFMEANNLKGKTVIPFATSGGSTIDKACEDLKAAYPDVNWKSGRLLNNVTDDDLRQWADSNK